MSLTLPGLTPIRGRQTGDGWAIPHTDSGREVAAEEAAESDPFRLRVVLRADGAGGYQLCWEWR